MLHRTTPAPTPGLVEEIARGVRRILAPNPSPMTLHGTNCYLVGKGQVAVIDPGPDLPAHRAALLAALGADEQVAAILVTHAHLDHSAGVAGLAAATGAPVFAFGDALAGRSAAMARFAASGLAPAPGEGVDRAFVPDRQLCDGEWLELPGLNLRAIWTPGHFGNHLAFVLGDLVFTGDVVMGWTTTTISPPDGDIGQYMATLDRLAALGARRFLPGHGPAIDDPARHISLLQAHRRSRDAAVRVALEGGARTAAEIAAGIYAGLPDRLMRAAEGNVLAHLLALTEAGAARMQPGPDGRPAFEPA